MERYPIEQKDKNHLETKSQVANIREQQQKKPQTKPKQKNPQPQTTSKKQPHLKTVQLKTSL